LRKDLARSFGEFAEAMLACVLRHYRPGGVDGLVRAAGLG
jgi:hypothetical protein